jgi:hypothetical protein
MSRIARDGIDSLPSLEAEAEVHMKPAFLGGAQAVARIFLDTPQIDWENACELGLNGSQCEYLSFGLTGTIIQ